MNLKELKSLNGCKLLNKRELLSLQGGTEQEVNGIHDCPGGAGFHELFSRPGCIDENGDNICLENFGY